MFKGRTLLITGGTGSFGNAVLRRFVGTDIGEIRIFSRDEKKQDDMRHFYASSKIKFYVGDVRDYSAIESAMRGVDYVFSAAALKQVPSCEFYPMEAVKTNIEGTANTIQAASANGVKRLVVLSTDKAVYPVNAMGMSKALMEKVMVAVARSMREGGTRLCGTRYGNVLASRGSVIPLFIRQIRGHESITVTDPDMTRFMMSLEDAVDLVLFAYESGEQGDIFVQKAPAATMGDLAKALNELLGGESEVKVIGTRHGEKLYETLLSREESVRAMDLGRYFRVPMDGRDLNYDRYLSGDDKITAATEYTSHNTERLDMSGLKTMLSKLDCVRKAIEDERYLPE